MRITGRATTKKIRVIPRELGYHENNPDVSAFINNRRMVSMKANRIFRFLAILLVVISLGAC
jgi:hypothetical protein